MINNFPSIKELRKNNEKTRKYIINNSTHYKTLAKRKYKEVEGYYTWDNTATDIASFIELSLRYPDIDHTSKLIAYLGLRIKEAFPPIYWVTKDLIESLLYVDIPNNLLKEDIIPVAPYIIFMLPKEYITGSRGEDIKWIGIHFIDKSTNSINLKVGKENVFINSSITEKLTWVACSDLMVGYSSTKRLPLTKEDITTIELYKEDKYKKTAGVFSEDDTKLSNNITKIVIQLLLILQHKPTLIVEEVNINNKKPYIKVKDRPKEKIHNPVWLGKNFNTKKVYKRINSKKNINRDSSIYPYWVVGHWRRVVSGKRLEGNRKLVFIESYKVLGPLKVKEI